ncbi:MAG: thiamine pyrophosphate-dependent enzyme, partial [Planctomycetia bacterium]
GGSIHVVVNNQIGFTTSPHEAGSVTYCTDAAKIVQIPIFHVNGEDPEAVAQVVKLAIEFRHAFHRDVVIDMVCFRRRGHNETDEPKFTQPVLYRHIDARKRTKESYLDHLEKLGGVTRAEADHIEDVSREQLEKEHQAALSPDYRPTPESPLSSDWEGYLGGDDVTVPESETGIPRDVAMTLLDRQTHVPEGFRLNGKIERILLARREMAAGKKTLDWASAEALAFASLAVEGHAIRLSGQDCERGTFSHRHAVLHDAEDGRQYIPLTHLDPNQAPVRIINSPLSESGVLGFDYGYSLEQPSDLVLWEAQFGDFCNAAQVIIDQFIVSAEDKWRTLSGVVMLLPHGFEGMGPEHSSARLERFLTLCAEDNIQVVNPTTPAQYFHLLRRQVLRPWRKPL